jgi:hypothetical protein
LYRFVPEDGAYRLRVLSRKSHVSREEFIAALRAILAALESASKLTAA